jgi:uncharacterized protein YkwD
MFKKATSILLLVFILTSCLKVSEEIPTPQAPLFVTSTLPPTRPGLSLPTAAPPTSTETSDAETTGTPGDTTSNSEDCKDSAVLLEDVTIPDNSLMPRGEKFTKTWRFMNTGKCNWNGYTITFVAGDRMGTPDSSAVPETEAGKTVDVSIELTAPSNDGTYTGFYELKNAKGESLAIGIEKSFWVKILIGNATAATSAPLTTPSGDTTVVATTGPPSCDYTTSSSYVNEIASLINNARAQNGLPALTINAQLAAAAQGHSIDMACHGFLGHNGSDGSSAYERIAAAGYNASSSEEIIFGSGYPQTAFDWWMNDQIHRNAILNPNTVEMGVGYAYKADTAYGGYYTVDFGSP